LQISIVTKAKMKLFIFTLTLILSFSVTYASDEDVLDTIKNEVVEQETTKETFSMPDIKEKKHIKEDKQITFSVARKDCLSQGYTQEQCDNMGYTNKLMDKENLTNPKLPSKEEAMSDLFFKLKIKH